MDELESRPVLMTSDEESGPVLSYSLCAKAALAFAAGIAIAVIVDAGEDVGRAAFAFSFYFVFLLLFLFVHALRKTPKTSRNHEVLKVPVWSLSVVLNLMVAHTAMRLISSPALLRAVWGFQGVVDCFLFYWLYLSEDNNGGTSTEEQLEPLLAAEV